MIIYGDSIEVNFNGLIYLARDRHYSAQYLSSGKSEKEALEDLEKTVKEKRLKYREELF